MFNIFNFNKQPKPKSPEEIIEPKSPEEKLLDQKIQELVSLGENYNNIIKIVEKGNSNIFNLTVENLKIKNDIIIGLNEDDLHIWENFLYALKLYSYSPVFTDSFHIDNNLRRKWENRLFNGENPIDKPDLYDKNRLANNNKMAIIGYMDMLSGVKDFICDINREIPKEFSYENRDENGLLIYDKLSDDDKIIAEKKFFDLVNRLIYFIEKS